MKAFRIYIPVLILIMGNTGRPAESTILLDHIRVVVQNQKRSRIEYHRRVRVNDERGKALGRVTIAENRFVRAGRLQAAVYDTSGRLIRQLRHKEVRHYAGAPGLRMYSDVRYRYFDIGAMTVPYIIDYRYRLTLKSLLLLPCWEPETRFDVKEACYELVFHEPIACLFYPSGEYVEPVTQTPRRMIWQLSDLTRQPDEYRARPEDLGKIRLWVIPEQFQLQNTRGRLTSWSEFGNWYRSLIEPWPQPGAGPADWPQMETSEPIQDFIARVFAQIQRETRYIGMEFGLYNWKPHASSVVWRNRYGDCKDLSNLVVAIFRNAGVIAYPALVRTRDRGMLDTAVTAQQFNHMVVYIPAAGAAYWLDPTDDFVTPADCPYWIEGCQALVLFDDTARFIRIPASLPSQNHSSMTTRLTVDTTGTVTAVGRLTATGNVAQALRRELIPVDRTKQERRLLEYLSEGLSDLRLDRYAIINGESPGEPLIIDFTIRAGCYANVTRNRLLISPHLNRGFRFPGEQPNRRRTGVCYPYAFSQTDTLDWTIPPVYETEAIIARDSLITPFGEYRTAIHDHEGSLRVCRQFHLIRPEIDRTDYSAYHAFAVQVEKTDQRRMVFRRKAEVYN